MWLLLSACCLGQSGQGSTGESTAPPAAAETSEPAFAAAQVLLRHGKYDEAISQLQSLAAAKPVPKGLCRELGAAYYQKGDYPKAIDYLKAAQAEAPDDRESTQLLGLSYYLSGHPADAIPYHE